ncbi:pleckstrin homology domain-containing family A member 6 isoform X1 [Periophthalmus magnuspinnatus]|uniref:pleckstrin homology domain-containing family A member 6 isoform X1 n=2 Tax=Periophthalmus magnuspinnatus TaxID=409849 RepID=UPI00145B88B6|nr:pleckstrin homology domain-containing family A member 6 isoform X1 [Periophthalmus magnuspinnatus]
MNGNTAAGSLPHSKSANMVSEVSQESQPYSRISRTPRKTASFGKRSNSMRRNPKAVVTKQGWLYKQGSSGVKQWNKRWFVLTDRCLFYYKDEKEDTILGSLPLLSFRVEGVEPSDNITRKFAFKVWQEDHENGSEEDELKGPVVFCVQAEHSGTRTYYFSADSHEEQQEWIGAMSQAADVETTQSSETSGITADVSSTMVTKAPDPQTPQTDSDCKPPSQPPSQPNGNGPETPSPALSCSRPDNNNSVKTEAPVEGPGGVPAHSKSHPNGWAPHNTIPRTSAAQSHHQERTVPPQEAVVMRRGFVPRTAPERVAQRRSSMAQLQQWVNQRRGMASQEDLHSPSRYYTVNRGVSEYYGYPPDPRYMDDYPLFSGGMRPDSICTLSAVGAYDQRWTLEDKRRSLRDGPHQLYGPPMMRDSWGPQHYGMETSMRRLSIQPRSRSVPRSPSSSSGGLYSPVPPNYVSPARSPSTRFDHDPARIRDDHIYADPSVYSLRRSLSSPKYDFPGTRRSLSQGLYHHSYPVSPSIHSKMVPPYNDPYSRELHPTLKLNEIETSKLLGRLCEQNRFLKDQEALVHRLRMDKDNLEDALLSTHQEMELHHHQPLAMEKLQFKKEALQNQLINIRGELSQASSALTTARMEFEALEDEANAIHGDLWEQLNAGGQSVLVRNHIQKEFWRVQDVLEALHKNNSSRGTNTAKHKMVSSGTFSTNSPASPLSSVSLTSPLSPFSPLPGSQTPPSKHPENMSDAEDTAQDRQSSTNKVGVVPPRTKSPTDEVPTRASGGSRYRGRMHNGISRERPKSAVFPAEVKPKMSVEEQNQRLRRNLSKRQSLNLGSHNYKVVPRRLTAHEIDIKELEAAVRGEGLESPSEEIARLRRLQVEPELYDQVLAAERLLEEDDSVPLSPAEQQEKQKKLERIRTLIAKSNLQNMVPVLDGPVDGAPPVSSQQQLQEQEKRIEISCALAAEASRRSRLLSARCIPSPPTSPTRPSPPSEPNSANVMKA